MNKIISETIDGSMKDIIQLKTLDSSLEYSQLFDALEDCPQDFKSKLIGALNSLGQTMRIPATDVFNQVLCASEDENAKKKLYNWWRAVFEVVSKSVPNVPEDKRREYEDKLDALISEICKAGDKASGNDVVLEDYEPADVEDEDKLKEDMTFAASKIGEIAKKVEELVNFLNPYCVSSESKEVETTMKNLNERGGSDWVSMDDMIGMEVGESDEEPINGDDGWKVIGQPIGESQKTLDVEEFVQAMMDEEWDMFDVYDGGEEDAEHAYLNVAADKERVSYKEVEDEFKSTAERLGWKFKSFKYSSDDMGDEDSCALEVWFEKAGEQVGEANVTVDANDVWDVLDLLTDEIANKNLTDLINSHVRTEDEIMDAINELSGDTITKKELNTLISGRMATIVDYLGLDVEKYEDTGDFVDSEKPVALEGTDWKDITEKLDANELADSIVDWESKSGDMVVSDANVEKDDLVTVDVLTKTDKNEEIKGMVDKYLLYNVSNWKVNTVEPSKKGDDGLFFTTVSLVPDYDEQVDEARSEGTEEHKPDEVNDGEKKYKQDGETKTLVTGEQKVVTEMTIEQEITDVRDLVPLLWGQGRENLKRFLESAPNEDCDGLLSLLEDYEIKNLTALNDLFAYEFERVLEDMGYDMDAWYDNLEIKRGGSEEVDEASKKVAPKDPIIAKIEETIPVDAKDGLIEIRPDRYGSYLAVYAPGSEPEMVAATKALSKAFPDYHVGYDSNTVAIWSKKRV